MTDDEHSDTLKRIEQLKPQGAEALAWELLRLIEDREESHAYALTVQLKRFIYDEGRRKAEHRERR